MATISIPPIEDFRKHLLFTSLYVHVHSLLARLGKVPSFDIDELIDADQLNDFMDRITVAGADGTLEIDEADVVVNYTSMLYVTKLLISPYDETIMNEILHYHPDSNTWGKFEDFRKNIVRINSFLLKDTEEKFPEVTKLFEVKERLGEIVFE